MNFYMWIAFRQSHWPRSSKPKFIWYSAPSIGNLTNLHLVLLQNNNISGHIPSEIGKLPRLDTLDLSNNKFVGSIPISVSNLRILKYLIVGNSLICATGATIFCCEWLETSSPDIKEQKNCSGFWFKPRLHLPTYSWVWISAQVESKTCPTNVL
ncbi:Leucine-rich repeat receptor-like kinase [Melia azedarach]|uniref:Leucine-rich repeat receptor-like kinase n=1 Tax=Melia azedarach TaxID=155640 RepID=A0ACC1Y6Z9_MELAZ|nr:Leucine-rich repeat receptor-like kinase [Melia azedarach]